MEINITQQLEAARVRQAPGPERFPSAHGILLSGKQWVGLAVLMACVVVLVPRIWTAVEPFELEPDYRIPYPLMEDYFFYSRVADQAAARYDMVLFGDSVAWGQYVPRAQTLTRCLNEKAGRELVANLGLEGAHPVALAGLVEHHASAIRGKKVVLHCNLLWLTSPEQDLQADRERAFFHPGLVPQFFPRIPAYREEPSRRLSVVVGRHVPFSRWTDHLQHAYFGSQSIPRWSMEHPLANPLGQITLKLPPSDDALRQSPISWVERKIPAQDFEWVPLEKSLQWRFFLRTLELLRGRGNQVLVVLGPFNEHMLKERGARAYAGLKRGVEAELSRRKVPLVVPPALPSEEYGDASHPLAAGYRRLADVLWAHEFFR